VTQPARRRLRSRARRAVAYRLSALGERLGSDALTYNPLLFRTFHALAVHDAPHVVGALAGTYPDAHRVVDVGAGSGAFAAEAQRRGLSAVALERSRHGRRYATRAGVDVRPFDLAGEPPAPLDGERFDLAYCLEVAEHVPADLSGRLVDFLAHLAPRIVLSAAPPGQGGQGHVNEQPAEYWVEAFARRGLRVDEERQGRLHAALHPRERLSGHWALTNVLAFARD
jgi:SAM-dependent methyltransferase